MQLNTEDFEEIRQNYNKALLELEDFENQTAKTKKEIILRLRDSVLLLVENEQLEIKKTQVSSYVWNELKKRDITYSEGHFWGLFEEDEKGKYSQTSLGRNHKHEFTNGECDCGDIEKGGIVFTPRLEDPEPKEREEKITPDKTNYLSPEHQALFQQYVINLKELASQSNDLLTKGEDSKTAGIIIQALPDPKKLLHQAKSQEAHLMALGKKLDARQKISEFMKLKAILLETCEFTIAHVAKLLSVTPKHLTNNVIKKSNPQAIKINPDSKNVHHDHLKWFKCIDFKCKCGISNIVDIDDWWTEQIARTRIKLSFNDPIIDYGVAR